jgi:hypothetical protein
MILLELQLTNRSEETVKIINAFESFGKANSIPRNVIHDMNVPLEEVLSNIILPALRRDVGCMIAARLTLTNRSSPTSMTKGGPCDPLTVARGRTSAGPPKTGRSEPQAFTLLGH